MNVNKNNATHTRVLLLRGSIKVYGGVNFTFNNASHKQTSFAWQLLLCYNYGDSLLYLLVWRDINSLMCILFRLTKECIHTLGILYNLITCARTQYAFFAFLFTNLTICLMSFLKLQHLLPLFCWMNVFKSPF